MTAAINVVTGRKNRCRADCFHAEAKQMAGSRNPQASGLVLYLFLYYYALSKDLNEVWSPQS